MYCKVKNNTAEVHTWCGQEIQAGQYYEIPETDIERWKNDAQVFEDVGNSNLIVNDGTKDFTNTVEGWNFLCGNELKTFDERTVVYQTSRPLSTIICFTSEGDDINDVTKVWGGQAMSIIHEIGNPMQQNIIVDFNVKENKTYIHEGYVLWRESNFDSICLEVIPTLTAYTPGTNTFFNLYAGFLIVPAAGDGQINVQPQDIRLVEIPLDPATGSRDTAFWNADYDEGSHQFYNITAAPMGNGVYNMFAAEYVLNRFVNKFLLLGNGFLMLQTAESTQIGHGMRLRMGLCTNAPDHVWRCSCCLTMHRAKTVSN